MALHVWNPGDFVLASDLNGNYAAQTALIAANAALVATALQAGPVNSLQQAATGKFFTQNGATINKLNDRVFVGGATANDGAYPNVVQAWIDTAFPPHTSIIIPAQFACLSTTGGIGGVFGTRSSDGVASTNTPIGLETFALNNNAGIGQACYALYAEARTMVSTPASLTLGAEIDIVNLSGSTVPNNPYTLLTQLSTCSLWLASGGAAPGAIDASFALGIGNNGAKYKSGIIFGATSITGNDGITAGQNGVAIQMAKGHSINWSSNVSGTVSGTGSITCVVNNPALATTLQFADTGLLVSSAARLQFAVLPSDPAANGTAVSISVNNNAGLNFVNVSLGAADSGGTGYRALRVPN